MSVKSSFIAELKQEAVSTQKLLERVPIGSVSWKPHEKSMSLGRLATHIAELASWVTEILTTEEIDFGTREFKPTIANSVEELLEIYRKNLDKALATLEATPDEEFDKPWVVKNDGQVLFTMPKGVCVRGWAYSHLYHHRGQLTVYLRMLNVPLPAIYGPSADEF